VDNNMGALSNHPRSVKIEKILADDFDEDDDTLSVSAVSPTSTHGGTVTLRALVVTYSSPTNFIGTDTFTMTISDGRGGIATATMTVQVYSENDPSVNSIGGVTIGTNGHPHVRFAGIPGCSYLMQRAAGVSGPWITIGSFIVPDNGIADFEDTNPLPNMAFYRTLAQ